LTTSGGGDVADAPQRGGIAHVGQCLVSVHTVMLAQLRPGRLWFRPRRCHRQIADYRRPHPVFAATEPLSVEPKTLQEYRRFYRPSQFAQTRPNTAPCHGYLCERPPELQ